MLQHQQRLRRNVLLVRLIRMSQAALLTISIIVVYYNQHGLGMQDVMWLQAIFGATMIVVEVPSGYFSDVLGRRRTMIIGAVLLTAGWTWYAFAHDFAGFLTAELLLGIGLSFISGTDSALLYDSLLDLGEGERGIYEEGRMLAYGNFSEAGAAVVGGFLAWISLHVPFYGQILCVLPTIPLSLMLVEPAQNRRAGHVASMREIWSVVVHVVLQDHTLRWLMATASVIGACTLTVLWMYQPYWEQLAVPVALFGIIWAAGNALVGVVSLRSSAIAARLGELRTIGIFGMVAIVSAGVLGMWSSLWLMPLFASFYICRGVANPIFTGRINTHVESGVRATVLSVRQLGVRSVFLITAPLVGFVADAHSLPTAFIASAIIFGVAFIAVFAAWHSSTLVNKRTSTLTH